MGDADHDMNDSMDTLRKAHVQSLPSDYSDVQPKSFDPEFISDISTKMQVPEKIGVSENMDRTDRNVNHVMNNVHGMTVPERILISEGGRHIGARQDLRQFDFEKAAEMIGRQHVDLRTPPRTLTLEEQFPSVEAPEEESLDENQLIRMRPNGDIPHTDHADPYTPGTSLNESVLMNEADEITKLQMQIRKLNHRIERVESDSKTLMNAMKYFSVGFFLWKFLSWWLHTKN